jgi:hypothetical protein
LLHLRTELLRTQVESVEEAQGRELVMPSDFDPKRKGDIIGLGPKNRPHRIERFVGRNTVVVQEMARDRIGRLRSLGEDGRFSTTRFAVRVAPLYKKGGK